LTILAIDLFCGVGGLTHGLELSGINVIAGYDNDEKCRFPYEKNNNSKFINKNISDLRTNEFSAAYLNSNVRILAGCAPCQPFSNYTQARPKDSRWELLNDFSHIVEKLRPELITMENVPELQKHSVFIEFVQNLEKGGYHVSHSVVYCPNYGIPQSRKRLVLMASLYGEINLAKPTHQPEHYETLQSTICDLPKLKAGETNKSDPLHRAAGLSDINMKRIKASKQGGSWKDWPVDLLADCHKKESGKKYTSIYGRMEWKKPSPTITTQFYNYGSGRHGHPTQPRAISVREAAILQSFPANYCFTKDNIYSITDISRMIGNAVPVRLGEVIGSSFLKHLEDLKVNY
jgi:DNA (cytosine-5)-methyltransferase 1